MRLLRHPLLFAIFALLAIPLSVYAQPRELGCGTSGPLKALHATAELIYDSSTQGSLSVPPAARSRLTSPRARERRQGTDIF